MNDELRIISVKAKKNGQSCLISFNNDDVLECSYDLVLKHHLSKNSYINSDLFSELQKEQRIYVLKQVAYNFVSYKPRTEKQIRLKLKEKGYDKSESDLAIEFLLKFDLVDDEKYAKQFISDYLKRKSAGKSKLISELIMKGIDKSLAKNVLNQYYPENAAYEIALRAANKKFKLIRNKTGEKQKSSLIKYLQFSGFDWDIIRKVLREFKFGDNE